ncbi:bombesin receptor subtype-3-like [Anneissia japonica]|uniref:bombesin receptor subtype-3-like n=1 Tax=Anneissia japonica TaxID=1529436 RepID=UPI001425A72E|nr:bombesin receptor subtype-3-like [Anneissia japonica]
MEPSAITLLAFNLFVGITGIIGNALLMVVVLSNASMRTIPNALICNMAFGDLFMLTVSVIVNTIYDINNGDFTLGHATCIFVNFTQVMSMGVSIFTLVALSVDRYQAIVKPMERKSSRFRTAVTIVIIWMVSIAAASSMIFLSDLVPESNGTSSCHHVEHNTNEARIFESIRMLLMYVLPLLLLCVFYIRIAFILYRSSMQMPGDGQVSRQVQDRKRLALIIMVLVLLFAILWLPYVVYSLKSEFITEEEYAENEKAYTHLLMIAIIMGSLNSTINPIALCMMSKNFRRYFIMYLSCKCFKRAPVNDYKTTIKREGTSVTRISSDDSTRRIKRCGGEEYIQMKPSNSPLKGEDF